MGKKTDKTANDPVAEQTGTIRYLEEIVDDFKDSVSTLTTSVSGLESKFDRELGGVQEALKGLQGESKHHRDIYESVLIEQASCASRQDTRHVAMNSRLKKLEARKSSNGLVSYKAPWTAKSLLWKITPWLMGIIVGLGAFGLVLIEYNAQRKTLAEFEKKLKATLVVTELKTVSEKDLD